MQGIIKGMQDERMAVVTQLQARFDEVEMAPVAVVEAEAEVEAEVEAAAAAQEEGCSKAPSRRQEALSRRQERGCSKARCFDTNEARRRRMRLAAQGAEGRAAAEEAPRRPRAAGRRGAHAYARGGAGE